MSMRFSAPHIFQRGILQEGFVPFPEEKELDREIRVTLNGI
ncbi:MAG: hypothetical protein RMK18_03570 [Armatimonadota bacterium]|nr:hypothetical protein [Armatimonadota bacterium]MCX7777005.1 hypothetical protein [Armatimonadota bacterium]MDW8024927.1 hypothetical protein [Armatimonadota bacterium]